MYIYIYNNRYICCVWFVVCASIKCLTTIAYFYKVVWDAIKGHWLLFSKGQKVSLGKYQQTTYNSLKTNHLHSLKGFFFSIACVKLGYWKVGGKTNAASKKAFASESSASSSMPVAMVAPVEGKASLKQEMVMQCGDFGILHTNQLERAARFFGNISNYHKANTVAFVMEGVAQIHSAQTKDLRWIENVIPWELLMMTGGCHFASRSAMQLLSDTRKYQSCGIETEWDADSNINLMDLRIGENDDRAQHMWDLVINSVLESEKRNLMLMVGLPRRKTLLLHESATVRQEFAYNISFIVFHLLPIAFCLLPICVQLH